MSNYYEELGLTPEATQDEIREAYRALAKKAHPDRAGGDAQLMASLNKAYETLGDPTLRVRYDSQALKLNRRTPQVPVKAPFDPLWLYYHLIEPLDEKLKSASRRMLEQLDELAGDPYDAVLSRQFEREVTKADQEIAGVTTVLAREEAPWPWSSALGHYEQGLRQIDDALVEFKSFSHNFNLDHLVDGRSILVAAQEILSEARERMQALL